MRQLDLPPHGPLLEAHRRKINFQAPISSDMIAFKEVGCDVVWFVAV